MLIEPHLSLTEVLLEPGGEWKPDGRGWTVAWMAQGFGYCLHHGSVLELKTGELVITGPNLEAGLRASQLGEVRLEFFRVIPQRLNGLITVSEWHRLERVSAQPDAHIFHYAAGEAPAQKFARLAALPERDSLAARSALLQLWAACVGGVLQPPAEGAVRKKKLDATFRQFVGKMSEQDLASSSMADLAAKLNCSERHLSRLFRAEYGMSLRDKQVELSLQRACQLLADPNLKIASVARDTGCPHLGVFNSMFKKHFGLSPKEWRQQHLAATPEENPPLRQAPPQCEGAPSDENRSRKNFMSLPDPHEPKPHLKTL